MRREKQFAILGLGRFGQSIVRTLESKGCEVLCCDKNPDVIKEVSKYANHVVQADVCDEHSLKELGLNNFDVVIVAIGENMESSIMATIIAKGMGVKMVIAKAKNEMQKQILLKVGADKVVLPERDMGARIATTLLTSSVIDFINLSDKFAIAEIEPLEEWIGLTLISSNIRSGFGFNVVAIKRNDDIIVSPNPDEKIYKSDILVVVGENGKIEKLSRR